MTRNMIKYKDFNHYRAVIVFVVIFIAFNMFVAIPTTKPVPSIGGAITLSIIYTLTCILFSVICWLFTSKD